MFPENIIRFLGQADTKINILTVLAYIYNLKFFAESSTNPFTISHGINPQLINTHYSFQILEEHY